jgi:hypothetical protein
MRRNTLRRLMNSWIATLTKHVGVYNSIVAGNEGGAPADDDVYGSFDENSSHNLIGVIDETTSTGLKDSIHGEWYEPLDAMLEELGDYGGTMSTHRLLENSAAIDAGSDSIAEYYDLLFDQRGEDRFEDGDGNGFDFVDIGAYEVAFGEFE